MSMVEHRFTHDEAVRPLNGVSEPTLITIALHWVNGP